MPPFVMHINCKPFSKFTVMIYLFNAIYFTVLLNNFLFNNYKCKYKLNFFKIYKNVEIWIN